MKLRVLPIAFFLAASLSTAIAADATPSGKVQEAGNTAGPGTPTSSPVPAESGTAATENAASSTLALAGVQAAEGDYNLTELGTVDWVYWASSGMGEVRKATGGNKIGMWTAVGEEAKAKHINNSGMSVSWTDGTPTQKGRNAGVVRITGQGNGFEIVVQATPEPQTLKLFTFTQYNATGYLDVTLDDGSAKSVSEYIPGSAKADSQVHTITFSSKASSPLRVRFTNDTQDGNIGIRAAYLK